MRQIFDLSAIFTDKVVMCFNIAIKAVKTASSLEPLDLLLINQNVDVPVDCTHAQVVKIFSKLVVDPVGSGVSIGAAKQTVDPLSLFASLVLVLINHLGIPNFF